MRFAALASGSRGNCAFIQANGPGLLLDLGLGASELSERLTAIGSCWDQIGAAVLTHTHSDHVNSAVLRMLAKKRIVLYCHEGHLDYLSTMPGCKSVVDAGLLRSYEEREPFFAPNGLQIEPIRLHHDSEPTFGFRIEGKACRRQRGAAIGYVADTGCWTPTIAETLTDVDLLAVEFNHDVEMQWRSGRPRHLIQRVLGPKGHLSNEQGAELASWVIERSRPDAVKHLVLLHLSEQCNKSELALKAARTVLKAMGRKGTTVAAAAQYAPYPDLIIRPKRRASAIAIAHRARTPLELTAAEVPF